MTSAKTHMLVRVGGRLAVVLDDATVQRLGMTADTPVRVTVSDGTLLIHPMNPQGRAALFESALRKMSARYEKTLRRLAE
jgi:antitoxin component of MazEF toxin-antitoxin module